MDDADERAPVAAGPHSLLFLREEEIRRGIELLFYGYRDFIAEPDAILSPLGLGRAHHRAMYFIGANPAIAVGDLMKILRITKQSLARVLADLMDRNLIEQRQDTDDRRRRLLSLTEQGTQLERQLFTAQRDRVAHAYRRAGPEAVAGFGLVLSWLIEDEHARTLLLADRTGRSGR